MTEYTKEMEQELRSLSPVTNEKAIAFADKYGISVHSVRQKCVRSDDIEYQKKPQTRKDGSAVEKKAEIVAEIAELCGIDADSFETLGNANRLVLVRLRDTLEAGNQAIADAEDAASE